MMGDSNEVSSKIVFYLCVFFFFVSHVYENHVNEGKLWPCFEGSSCY